MKSNLKNIIFYALINKKGDELTPIVEQKYSYIEQLLMRDLYNGDITAMNLLNDACMYIENCIIYKCQKYHLPLTESNIISLITPEFCISNAYDYLCFRFNEHEYAHESEEYLTR